MVTGVVDPETRESAERPATVVRRQVSLRGMFFATTYFAVSSALALQFGLGIFALMNGVFLMWLSFRGFLWWMQTNRARPWAYRAAWLIFLVSFGLPAMTVQGCNSGKGETNYGWQAALFTVSMAGEAFLDVTKFVQDSSQRTIAEAWELFKQVWIVTFWNLPNLLMLASPWLLYRQQRGKGRVLSLLFNCAALSTWTWGVSGGSDMRIGYYVWSGGITTIALASQPGWRTLAVLACLGAFVLAFSLTH